MEKIKSIKFLDDYKITGELDDGHKFSYDLQPKLHTARFAMLRDMEFFKSGKLVDNTYIKWNNFITLQNYELLSIKKGRS